MSFYPTHQIGRVLQHAGNKLLRHGSGKGIWIDVGAHHGEVTLSHAVSNPALIVYALEPNLRAASVTFGRAPNYIVIPMAVAETDGCAQLHINAFDEASSLLTINEASRRSWKGGEGLREERVITVPTIRLDTFMDRLGRIVGTVEQYPTESHARRAAQTLLLSTIAICAKHLPEVSIHVGFRMSN